ncbi:GTP-binding protein [Streptomyces clavuligerus]|uniref:GTP-binding protein n=2 Tax=Streptomyces clavuligerus TaxID=1901 RepID=UPI00020D9284|nr:ATP/GTP-binding protein [Streptomyces clavuligerus]WDN55963.1 ATP/GTP-binding protein [Streptomyces clavuligerus]
MPDAECLVKLVVTGGFGTGKTTLIGAVSEITPLRTEAVLTQAGTTTDVLTGVEGKTTTTVALDFGRLTFPDADPPVKVFFFGTPGQERFAHGWDGIAHGALGTVVLVDTSRLEISFPSLTFAEKLGIPFAVAVNQFAHDPNHYTPQEVRDALDLTADVPVITCDARDPASVARVLTALLTSLTRPPSPRGASL